MTIDAVTHAQIALEVASVVADEVEKAGGKPLSRRDLQAVLALLQGDMTRRQVQEATGLGKRQAQRALENLCKWGVTELTSPHDRGVAPISGLTNRANILNSIVKVCTTRRWGDSCDGGSPASYSCSYREKETGGATKAPAQPLQDAPPAAGLAGRFTTDAARSLIEGLACPSKRDQPTWKSWRQDPSLLQAEESRLFVNMCTAYRKDFANPIARTEHFAEVYWTVRTAQLGPSPMPIRENNPIWWVNLLLARQRADDTGLPYEVYIEGVRLHYEDLHNQDPSKFRSSFPEPHQLKTEKAAKAAREYSASLRDDFKTVAAAAQIKSPYTEDEFDPEAPDQCRYYQWVWEDALTVQHGRYGHGDVLAMMIRDGRLPRAVLNAKPPDHAWPEWALPHAWEALRPGCYGKEYDEGAERCRSCPYTQLSGIGTVADADDCETAFLKAKRRAEKAEKAIAPDETDSALAAVENMFGRSEPRAGMTPDELSSGLDKALGL